MNYKTPFTFFVLIIIQLALSHGSTIITDASKRCPSYSGRRNQKDHYGDPDDCHFYYQCVFLNETFSTGIKQSCPPHQFWQDEISQCVPELPSSPCQDQCHEEQVAIRGCYADPTSCSSFFRCSNRISYPMCCPPETRFNPRNCECEDDHTCLDTCQRPAAPMTTVKPPTSNATHCVDSFGATLATASGAQEKFQLFDDDTGRSITLVCPVGSTFQLNSCRCETTDADRSSGTCKATSGDTYSSIAGEPNAFHSLQSGKDIACPPGSRFSLAACSCVHIGRGFANSPCLLYLPFDQNFDDKSIYSFSTFPNGLASIEKATFAKGRGSLSVQGGWVEIPGLKGLDLGKTASWCLFFKCKNGNDSSCTLPGGLISNNKDASSSEYSVIVASNPPNIDIRVNLAYPDATYEVSVPNTYSGDDFIQLCVTYDGAKIAIYVNRRLVSATSTSNGQLNIGQWPYSIGSDQTFGDFHGFIDEVLICDRALSGEEVGAHFFGQVSLAAYNLIPPLPQYDLQIPPLFKNDSSWGADNVTELIKEWLKFKIKRALANRTDSEPYMQMLRHKVDAVTLHNLRYLIGLETYRQTNDYDFFLETSEEFRKRHTGLNFEAMKHGKRSSSNKSIEDRPPLRSKVSSPSERPEFSAAAFPNFDWRHAPPDGKNCVGPVVEQGSCGCCYAFAASAVLESARCAQFADGTVTPVLSPQMYVDCTSGMLWPGSTFGNMGCGGGYYQLCFDYTLTTNNSKSWTAYPYTASDGPCEIKDTPNWAHTSGYYDLPKTYDTSLTIQTREEALQRAVYYYGPAAVSIYTDDAFANYESGVFNNPACAGQEINHAVALIGWTEDAWILKNAWGIGWGENGYMRIRRESKGGYGCGILEWATIVESLP